MIACDSGIRNAPQAPCPTRSSTSAGSDSAAPQNSENSVNPPTATKNRFLRPMRALSQPVAGSITALATMYEVSTQEIWSWVAENVPCMCGSATAAIVQSIE